MSKKQKHTKQRANLNFEEAKKMTIEEAVRKDTGNHTEYQQDSIPRLESR